MHPDNEQCLQDADREITRIRDLLGLSDSRADEADEQERVLAAVLSRIEREPAAQAPLRRRLGARKAGWWVAAAAMVTGIVVAVNLTNPDVALAAPPGLSYRLAQPLDVADGTAPPAREALLEVAESAGRMDDPRAEGSVQFIHSFGWYLAIESSLDDGVQSDRASILPIEERRWTAKDGSHHAVQMPGTPLNTDGSVATDPVETVPGPISTWAEPAGAFADPTLAAIPRDPEGARHALLDGLEVCFSDEFRAICLVDAVNRLFVQHVVPPDLAAVLWQVLAAEEEVRLLGEATDRLGRPSMAIGALTGEVGHQSVLVLLVDPETGMGLGNEIVTIEAEYLQIDRPTVTGFTTIVTTDRVDALGELPE